MGELERVQLVSTDGGHSPGPVEAWWAGFDTSQPLTLRAEPAAWEEDISSLPSDVRDQLPETGWSWAIYPWCATAVLVPDEATTHAVLTSRNYPIVTRMEQERLHRSHVVLAGLSTGRAVAQQLVRLGVGSLHLVDGDHLAPSNTNRLVGTRLSDLGLSKTISTARELLEFNPYLRVTTAAAFLDEASLADHLSEHETAAVVEMIDGLPAKVGIRLAARRAGVPVVMATDMDWDPMVDVDYPDAAMFGGRLTEDDLGILQSESTSFAEKTEVAMRAMGLSQWAPRSFLSGELARSGLVGFWSQTAPSAAVCGALVARAVLDIVREQRIPRPRAVLSIRDAIGTDDPIDEAEPLYQQLQGRGGKSNG
jgi:hypothetical protein